MYNQLNVYFYNRRERISFKQLVLLFGFVMKAIDI